MVKRRLSGGHRRGAVLVIAALLSVVLIGMVAFAVDIGYILLTKTELQKAVDATAYAAAGQLVNGPAASKAEGLKFLALNKVGGRLMPAANANFEFGMWDDKTRSFSVNNNNPEAVRVSITDKQQPLFFARIFGKKEFDTTAQAVTLFKPRDIALVLDITGSMAYDSDFFNTALMGQATIEKNLKDIYDALGKPKFGKLKWKPVKYGTTSTSAATVKANFGLDKVKYPYPGGSWDEYIGHVQGNSYVAAAGYQCSYGYMTWVDYLQQRRPSHADTPDLWKTPEHPLQELKDAVTVFTDYLTAHCKDDRLSLSCYSYSDGTAVLEQALTTTYSLVSTAINHRQAGHYIGGTNISAGMTKGRLDLQKNGRNNALTLMVLMTDGKVNLPTGNTATDKQLCIDEANACAKAGIPVITISVGALADVALMQQIADITGGAAFVVPGGQPTSAVKDQLEAVFAKVAADRPLQLVQ